MNYSKLQRRFAIVCLISILLIVPPTQAYAYTVKECQTALVNYAKDFAEKKGSDTHYYVDDWSDDLGSERAKSYLRDEACGVSSHQGSMGMDCVGWVSYAIHHCYGIGSTSKFDYFVTPQNGACSPYYTQKYDMENMEAGDIIIYSGSRTHVAIYVGDGKMVDGANGRGLSPCVALRDYDKGAQSYGRLTDASGITTLIDSYNGTGLKASGASGTSKSIDYANFYFNGIPDGKYSLASRKNIFEILIEALKELINFFIGLITYLFRGLIIGIISVFDRLLNNTIQSVNDSPKSLQESGVKATNADDPYSMNRSVTIEGLIFNDVDLFDINIFKVN